MSEMHQKAIKEKKLKVSEVERDKVFLQEQVVKARNKSYKIKQALQAAQRQYDVQY